MAANVRHDSRVHLIERFALLDPLLARPALVVESSDAPGLAAHVRHDEADAGKRRRAAVAGARLPRELVEAIVRPEIDEADENIGKIGLGLDVVKFAGPYQRRDDGPIFSTIIVTGKESIARKRPWLRSAVRI